MRRTARVPKLEYFPARSTEVFLASYRETPKLPREFGQTCKVTSWLLCPGIIWAGLHLAETTQRQMVQLTTGQGIWMDISPKQICKWAASVCKDAQRHWSPGKCKSKWQWDTPSHRPGWPQSRKEQKSQVSARMRRNRNPRTLLVGPPWKTVRQFPKTFNTEAPCDPAKPRLGTDPIELKMHIPTNTCTQTFRAKKFTVAKRWK